MLSPLLLVFAVELGSYLVNVVGPSAINNILWNLYLALPSQASRQAAETKKAQKEYLTIRRDLNATSSQDQFAKWAKLRRQHDKLLEELEKMKSSYDASKANFDRSVNIIRWSGTTVLKIIFPLWYAKQPMFWLPQGWFPYYAEWILSFPRAPIGSVSTSSWQVASLTVVMLVGDIVTMAIRQSQGTKAAPKQQTTANPAEEKGRREARNKKVS
ncbi:CHD5-like protein-domain-containing protein [Durotheca rogersii]|uniref:CHD5-like protein-domain-containing protein n=1 Tax=Durotheca rogersii TaxID=419775 RepID=UPI00221F0ACC|nr:CHD5-like protein-domain-containing protein [Durotheca rogersii]KAI5862360.1 CHD5-like protein-domain-containing protein [Durotheca rogersii]